ncbi:hypothetical protein TVAG_319690 [Trichomonas vaginalis G3]|uniref:Uncharacterized protein n=1 Tax=Trichomonas vaginalis (strain ATCC PRA-98 / G3) TaxID=412133 RepID=A2DQB7_TRIV3|nr:hypothetical protein TVAGG3_1009510 [Trichomonas vaginalis G3]EAY17374.1 hypothetical protein TVAG_319690 [Trichomonas vaginalis G3]KAI5491383.1 hypothetical protein TVAGG3_1009510 [Trichomonas vaginalis G3]|eukprot:XP_001330743.1 hypothetical protein [Trichomonas vaginalis G3]
MSEVLACGESKEGKSLSATPERLPDFSKFHRMRCGGEPPRRIEVSLHEYQDLKKSNEILHILHQEADLENTILKRLLSTPKDEIKVQCGNIRLHCGDIRVPDGYQKLIDELEEKMKQREYVAYQDFFEK